MSFESGNISSEEENSINSQLGKLLLACHTASNKVFRAGGNDPDKSLYKRNNLNNQNGTQQINLN